jgi:hypothetical protein
LAASSDVLDAAVGNAAAQLIREQVVLRNVAFFKHVGTMVDDVLSVIANDESVVEGTKTMLVDILHSRLQERLRGQGVGRTRARQMLERRDEETLLECVSTGLVGKLLAELVQEHTEEGGAIDGDGIEEEIAAQHGDDEMLSEQEDNSKDENAHGERQGLADRVLEALIGKPSITDQRKTAWRSVLQPDVVSAVRAAWLRQAKAHYTLGIFSPSSQRAQTLSLCESLRQARLHVTVHRPAGADESAGVVKDPTLEVLINTSIADGHGWQVG